MKITLSQLKYTYFGFIKYSVLNVSETLWKVYLASIKVVSSWNWWKWTLCSFYQFIYAHYANYMGFIQKFLGTFLMLYQVTRNYLNFRAKINFYLVIGTRVRYFDM